jgi:hypothetical protein
LFGEILRDNNKYVKNKFRDTARKKSSDIAVIMEKNHQKLRIHVDFSL